MSDEAGQEEKMPPWWKLTTQIGVPAAIAVFLVWTVTMDIKSEVKASNVALRALAAEGVSTKETMIRFERQQDTIVALLRTQCVNAAKSTYERNDCLRAGR